jgi:hypothetical protein
VHHFFAGNHAGDHQVFKSQWHPKCLLIALVNVELAVIEVENAAVLNQSLQLFWRGQVYFMNQIPSSQVILFDG